MPSFLRRQAAKANDWAAQRDAFYERVETSDLRNRPEIALAFVRIIKMRHYALLAGSAAGDAVALQVERIIAGFLHAGDIMARETQTTFLVACEVSRLETLATLLNEQLGAIDCLPDQGPEAKIGYCPMFNGVEARDLGEYARAACESIRFTHTADVSLFDEKMRVSFEKRRYVTESLDDAIARGEIHAYAQPIVRVMSGRVCEVEILARWESEQFGMIMPTDFVPMLEHSRLIHKLDAEIIRLAMSQWKAANELGVSVPLGINLSRLDFELCDIYQIVRDIMNDYDVPIEDVHIEITESATTGHEDLLREGVRQFREAGFTVYMDDFGTGYSSLEGLRDSDYDVVKLDMGLIRDIEENERSRVVVAEAVNIAKRLGMQTLCEGVETLEQLRFLRMIGCEKAQGYFFGRPVAHDAAIKRLTEEAERYEESGLKNYLDDLGRINLIDGSRSNVQGVEASVFLGDNPVAIVELRGRRIICLASNAGFSRFIANIGMPSFEDVLARISAGTGEMRTRMELAAQRARETGEPQDVDFIIGEFYSIVTIEFVSATEERAGYIITASSISSSEALGRERNLELVSPFLLSIYKRIDLFDLNSGTSENLYLNAPLLRSTRNQGIIYSEIREFCERNIHPDDQERFLEFYDLSTLNERVNIHDGRQDTAILRTRIPEGGYRDHLYMLIPMVVKDRHLVLSTLRDTDVSTHDSYEISRSDVIPDTVLLECVLEGADRNIFWKDANRRFLGANQAFLDYYGFKSLDEIRGKNDEDLGWHVDNDPFRNDELRVLRGEVVNRARGACYARNELRAIEATKRPIIIDDKVVGLVGYFHDLGPAEQD